MQFLVAWRVWRTCFGFFLFFLLCGHKNPQQPTYWTQHAMEVHANTQKPQITHWNTSPRTHGFEAYTMAFLYDARSSRSAAHTCSPFKYTATRWSRNWIFILDKTFFFRVSCGLQLALPFDLSPSATVNLNEFGKNLYRLDVIGVIFLCSWAWAQYCCAVLTITDKSIQGTSKHIPYSRNPVAYSTAALF